MENEEPQNQNRSMRTSGIRDKNAGAQNQEGTAEGRNCAEYAKGARRWRRNHENGVERAR
jgi:hypothetical protein